MALLETLTDNFNDNSLDVAKWNTYGTNVNETNQRLELTSLAGGEYLGYDADNLYDMTSSYALIELVNAGDQTIVSLEVYPLICAIDGSNHVLWFVGENVIRAYKKVAGVQAQVGSGLAYNSTNHRWFRIRESGGTTYWDYSADGSGWTNYQSQANPIAVTSIRPRIELGTWQAEASTTTAQYDNFNLATSIKDIIGMGVIPFAR